MSENPYTNLDARALQAQAQRIREIEDCSFPFGPEIDGLLDDLFPEGLNKARADLERAAQHLQSMDEKLSRHIEGSFSDGVGFAQRDLVRTRSNLLPSGREILDEDGARIIAALAQGPEKVRRIPAGMRATPKPQVVEIAARKSAPARTGFKLGDL